MCRATVCVFMCAQASVRSGPERPPSSHIKEHSAPCWPNHPPLHLEGPKPYGGDPHPLARPGLYSLELGAPPIPEGLSPVGPPFTTLCSPSDPSKKERRSLGWRERLEGEAQSCLCLYLRPVGARGVGVLSLLHPLPDSGLGVAASWWPRGHRPEGLPLPPRG